MNLIRLIAIGLIVYLVIQIFKRWSANKNTPIQEQQEQLMVRCETCQLHIPKNEALQKDNKFYCSQEHLDDKQD